MKRLIACALALVLFVPAPVASVSWPSGTSSASQEAALASLVQQEHARVCGSPLAVRAYQHNRLDDWRARDMVARNYFGHTILGTSRRAGDYFARYGIRYWLAWGEILATNTGYSNPAETAFQQFMGSTPHRDVIQNCRYNAFGVGSYMGSGGKAIFALTFSQQKVERLYRSRLSYRSGPGWSYRHRYTLVAGETMLVFSRSSTGWERVFKPGRARGWAWGRAGYTR